ncbi:hypothetical protein COLO4_28326 [Corchorus olitorius]|uniref:Uncharacterized protein n=1 Tax=Corchorus olitorius TaxID=93759 RepID=A0A1R3HLH5_9ROSI|nr:hypothetical protein COLO4_28326 [Corchorus olitorius]
MMLKLRRLHLLDLLSLDLVSPSSKTNCIRPKQVKPEPTFSSPISHLNRQMRANLRWRQERGNCELSK